MQLTKILFAALFTVFITNSSCSQTTPQNEPGVAGKYVGSTPADSLIRSLLRISPILKVDFIKWDLSLQKLKSDSGTFQLIALYGISQNNTNGFIDGGNKLEISGSYGLSNGTSESPDRRLYRLNANSSISPVLLIEMDENVLHFADSNKKLLIGNGGWGYVLNRIK